MFSGIENIFDKYQLKLGKIRKTDYEKRFEAFMSDNRSCFEEMFSSIAESDDKEEAAKQAADSICTTVIEQYGKRGKIPSSVATDLSMFFIYYVFPTIIKIDNVHSKLLADAIRDQWRIVSRNKVLDYTTYEEIHSSFKERIFGFPVG